MKPLLPFLTVVLLVSCSKQHFPTPPHKGNDQVSWRFVVYDSNYSVADSTKWIAYSDTIAYPTVYGQTVFSIAPIPGNDTIYWPKAASFGIVVGPYNLGPYLGNIQVVKGGCAFNSLYLNPVLDRAGWNLQRSEKGKIINMFANPNPDSYDGKFNDFPYVNSYNGMEFPYDGQSDYMNLNWICGTIAGSCQLGPGL